MQSLGLKCRISAKEGQKMSKSLFKLLVVKITFGNFYQAHDVRYFFLIWLFWSRLYRYAYDDVRAHLRQLLNAGIMQPSHSPWASNVVLVRKKDKTLTLCRLPTVICQTIFHQPLVCCWTVGHPKWHTSVFIKTKRSDCECTPFLVWFKDFHLVISRLHVDDREGWRKSTPSSTIECRNYTTVTQSLGPKCRISTKEGQNTTTLCRLPLLVTSIKPMMSDISISFGCSDPACTDTGCSSHIMAFGGMLMVFVVTLEILLTTPWYLSFRCILLRERELQKNNNRIGLIRTDGTKSSTITPNTVWPIVYNHISEYVLVIEIEFLYSQYKEVVVHLRIQYPKVYLKCVKEMIYVLGSNHTEQQIQ
jgi:hypothetical protein